MYPGVTELTRSFGFWLARMRVYALRHAFDTPYADGRVRISRGVGLTSPLQELRIFERIGGEEKKVYASWQEEEDALAEAAARGEELAAIDDRWQEGGFDEAEAMDFDGDYDDDGGMPDS